MEHPTVMLVELPDSFAIGLYNKSCTYTYTHVNILPSFLKLNTPGQHSGILFCGFATHKLLVICIKVFMYVRLTCIVIVYIFT